MDTVIITAVEDQASVVITPLSAAGVTITPLEVKVTIGPTAPANPTANDLWVDTSNN